ncbi:MAG: hypothetical protein EPN97_09855 [Alphaproteobacteria bacterium]|nr:MAG: hypothetical protein EPN97_09855 [Alphaproteobacteria bacterium]
MLKVNTPFRVLFNLDSSKIAAQPGAFTEFLKKVRAALDDPHSSLAKKIHPALDIEVNLPKTKSTDSSSARDHGRFFLSPHVMILRWRGSYRDELQKLYDRAASEADSAIEKYSTMVRPDLESLFVKLNDNTIAVLSLDMQLDRADSVRGKEGWNRLNEWVSAVIKTMLADLYPQMIFPLLKGLNDFANETKDYFVYDVSEYKIFFVLVGDPKNPYPDLHKRFIPMKTNLTLCVEEGSYEETRWITNITRQSAAVRLKEAEIHISDENNLVVMSKNMDMKCLDILWELVASASYYYIAMNVININLIRYIGITSDKHTTKGLRAISRDMENIINSVTIMKLRYNDLAAELNGVSRKIFNTLQKEWDFKNITDNMQSKLELCRTNIQTLSVEMQRRNQGRIETVLTGVAGMTIVSVFIDLAAYATQLPNDKRNMVGDIPGFMDLGFIMSGNSLSWIGIFLAASVLAFTIKHRSG